MWRSIVVVEMPKVSYFEKAGHTSDGRAIYEAKNNRKTERDKLNYYEKETLLRMSTLKSEGKLDKFVDLA